MGSSSARAAVALCCSSVYSTSNAAPAARKVARSVVVQQSLRYVNSGQADCRALRGNLKSVQRFLSGGGGGGGDLGLPRLRSRSCGFFADRWQIGGGGGVLGSVHFLGGESLCSSSSSGPHLPRFSARFEKRAGVVVGRGCGESFGGLRGGGGRSSSTYGFSSQSFSGNGVLGTRTGGRGFGGGLVARSSAAGSSALPPQQQQGFSGWWSSFWARFAAVCASVASQLQRVRIGWFSLLTMLKIAIFATGAFAAYFVSRRVWHKIRQQVSESAGGEGGDGGPMQVLARGATCLQANIGPWSMSDMALGLTAMAKVCEKQPPALPGQEVKDLTQDSSFLLRAQHYRTLSEAVYAKDSASFSLFSGLPESSIVASSWEPSQDSLRPAYAVLVDPSYGAVILAVRGTSHVIDMLVNSGASPEPFGDDDGHAHGGFLHAAEMLHGEVVPHIEKGFKEHGGNQKGLKLVIVGHSMGAAVGVLMGLKLREKYPDLQCWGFSPPACLTLNLAKECKSFATSFLAAHDLVPRFSIHSVEKLRSRIQDFDWEEVERVAKDDEDWQSIKSAMDTFRGYRQSQTEVVEKLNASGPDGVDFKQKATDIKEKVMSNEMTGKVLDLVQKANNFIDGKDEKEIEEEKKEEGKSIEDVPSLHPPGRLLVLGSDPPGCGKMPEQRSDVASERNYGSYPTFDEARKVTWRMHEAEQEDVDEIVVSPWCVSDHMLGNMCEAIGYFQSHCSPAIA